MKNNKNLKSMNKKNMEKGKVKMEKFIEDEIIERKMQENFTKEIQDRILKKSEEILLTFPAYSMTFKSELWKKAFNSKELANNIKKLKNFENEKYISPESKALIKNNKFISRAIKNINSSSDCFDTIENNILVLATNIYDMLKKSEKTEVAILLAILLEIEEEILSFESMVVLSSEFFKTEIEHTYWSYTSISASIMTDKMHKFNEEIFDDLAKDNINK